VSSILGVPGWASHHPMRFAALTVTETLFNPTTSNDFFILGHITVLGGQQVSLVIIYEAPVGGNPRHGDMNIMGI
jgi:hypothetical protein